MESVYLLPGKLTASRVPTQVTTVLGSCVAVCLYDQVNKIGGINHYMLPLWNGEGLATPKYGNIAIEKLYQRMQSLGANPRHMVAKIFGGASAMDKGEGIFQIGSRNISIARNILEEMNIQILSHHLGGNRGRNIKFNTQTGEVLLRMVRNSNSNENQKFA